MGKNVEIQISKTNDGYKIIDKTLSIKNPPINFKELNNALDYIKSAYKDCKIAPMYDCIWITDQRVIERGLRDMLIQKTN